MSNISRRQLLTTGAMGATGFATAVTTQMASANAQNSSEAQTRVTPNGRFTGKVVLITGATSGIGEATARAFADEGATVHFCGRRESLGKQVAQSIRSAGGKATYQRADVCIEEDVKAFVNACMEQYGHIDIAFNNAGIESTPNTITDRSLEEWINVMTTNATGVFLSMKYEIPHMVRQGRGVIVNNASVSGHVGFATIAPYSASKHAVLSLTKVAALEYSDKNIRINAFLLVQSIHPCCAVL